GRGYRPGPTARRSRCRPTDSPRPRAGSDRWTLRTAEHVRGRRDGQRHHHRTHRVVAQIGIGQILIALAIGVTVWVVSMKILRILATPPPPIDPEDVVDVEDQD